VRWLCWIGVWVWSAAALAAPSITGVSDKSRHINTATFTVSGATSADLNGQPVAIGTPVTVTMPQYHELTASDGTAVVKVRFIVKSSERGSSEDGIPPMTPHRLVPDAPSAFANGVLQLTVPARYPKNLPIPVAARLIKGLAFGPAAGEPLWLNGTVTSTADWPASPILLRRGWGSTLLPARNGGGTLEFAGSLHSLNSPASITIEDTTSWSSKSGVLTSTEDWGANARIWINSDLTLAAGVRLTIGAGSVIRCASGVDITVPPAASVAINGAAGNPVVFVSDAVNQRWGGFWLQPGSAGSRAELSGSHTLFCGWGADDDWLDTAPHDEISNHRPHQPLVAISQSASLSLVDCALIGPIDLQGQRSGAFAMNDGSLNLTRCLVQRCITGGQQNRGSVEIHSCALLEMVEPGVDVDGPIFVDEDNDGLYLVPGDGRTYRLSRTVIGWCRDDGIDTGASGGGATLASDCWFENCTHEAISNSGANRRPESLRGVHFNNGQAMECGYGSGGVGPQSLIDRSLLIGNMVGARYGDNYGGGSWSYGGTLTVRDSLLLHNTFHDAWAIEFTSWAYQNQRLSLTSSRLTHPGDLAAQSGVEDGANALWNPQSDGPLLAPFMPVPDSEVGADLTVSKRQDTQAAMPSEFTVRLSSFSSRPVMVPWRILGKPQLDSLEESVLAEGLLSFTPGETIQSFAPFLPANHGASVLAVELHSPTHAMVSGPPAFYLSPEATPPPDAGLSLARVGSRTFLVWSDPARSPLTGTDLVTWIARPDLTSPMLLTAEETRRFWR
jgi:hypothetical protein